MVKLKSEERLMDLTAKTMGKIIGIVSFYEDICPSKNETTQAQAYAKIVNIVRSFEKESKRILNVKGSNF